MFTLLAQDPSSGLDFASILSTASPALMLAIFIVAMLKKWLVLPREIEELRAQRDRRILELETERDEYKAMAFKVLNIGERVAAATEDRGSR